MGAEVMVRGRKRAGLEAHIARQHMDRMMSTIPRRELWRCKHCNCVVEDRDRGAHLHRCWPEVLLNRFTKVD